MNIPRQNQNAQFACDIRELGKELVRGQEQGFLRELRPLVESGSLRLDLSRTDRIDAAGLAALVSLYCDARRCGHEFAVVNPTRRVARVLEIVGLERMIATATPGERLAQSAPLNLEMVA